MAALDDEAREHVKFIASGARRLSQLIDDLLAFSRTARAGMRKTKTSLKTLCDSVLRDLARAKERRDVEWMVGELPEINGDAALLRQVFINLIGNALKYTRRRQHARIEISSHKTGDELIVMVKDNGVGFDMRYASKLFGVFQRLASAVGIRGHRHWSGQRAANHPSARRPHVGGGATQPGRHLLLFPSAARRSRDPARMKKEIHILMVEDDDADAGLEQHTLRSGGIHFSLGRVQTEERLHPRAGLQPAGFDFVRLFDARL